jgi:heat shock protein HslJ
VISVTRSLFAVVAAGTLAAACGGTKGSGKASEAPPPAAPLDQQPGAPLENTYWKVMELRGRPVSVVENQREPYVQFRSGNRVAGSGGCNRLMGSYTLAGDTLRLSGLATTLMACAQGMEQEQALLDALGTVNRYAITRDTLRLYASDDLVARLEARYMN